MDSPDAVPLTFDRDPAAKRIARVVMHIELTEFLRCPQCHGTRSYCVLMPETIVERDVRSGAVACPVCHAIYRIVGGVVVFSDAADRHPADAPSVDATLPPAGDVRALLGVVGPGGYVVVLGSACELVPELQSHMPGVHCVLVNPPAGLESIPSTSSVRSAETIPLAPAMARGIVIGRDHAGPPWLGESARLLLRGLRMVVVGEPGTVPGVKRLAVGSGVWVGERE